MSAGTLSVQAAIEKGLRQIAVPTRIILRCTTVLAIAGLYYSWMSLFLFPAGIILSWLHNQWARPRWRIWAYTAVTDIHQLQRSAEYAGLLLRLSHDKANGFIGPEQKAELRRLIGRFREDIPFTDDTAISEATIIYNTSLSRKQVLILSNSGISVYSRPVMEWNTIMDERIIVVSYHSISKVTGTESPGGKKRFFRFENADTAFEFALGSIRIAAWQLDLLLYIYRGRYNSHTAVRDVPPDHRQVKRALRTEDTTDL